MVREAGPELADGTREIKKDFLEEINGPEVIRLSPETYYVGSAGCWRIWKNSKDTNTGGWRYLSANEVLVVRAQGLEFGSPAPT